MKDPHPVAGRDARALAGANQAHGREARLGPDAGCGLESERTAVRRERALVHGGVKGMVRKSRLRNHVDEVNLAIADDFEVGEMLDLLPTYREGGRRGRRAKRLDLWVELADREKFCDQGVPRDRHRSVQTAPAGGRAAGGAPACEVEERLRSHSALRRGVCCHRKGSPTTIGRNR